MTVEIKEKNEVVWVYGEGKGIDNRSYDEQKYREIKSALQAALKQVNCQIELKTRDS